MGAKQEPCIPRPGCSAMGRGRVSGKHLYNLIVGLIGPFRAQQKFLDRILAPRVHQYRCFAIRPRLFPFPPFSNTPNLVLTGSNPPPQLGRVNGVRPSYRIKIPHLKGVKLGSTQFESVHVKGVYLTYTG